MKVLVLGSSGIIGQHMRLCVPDGVTPVWHRRHGDTLHIGRDLSKLDAAWNLCEEIKPDAIVNLAGESSTDEVERNPTQHEYLNARMPMVLAEWCEGHSSRLIQVSTQAVFGGEHPPYGPHSTRNPVNKYGKQKLMGEGVLSYRNAIVARPTFVLGVRPLPYVGRMNPVEQMLSAVQSEQVEDRFFSPLFAEDAATLLWRAVLYENHERIIHLGIPQKTNRAGVAYSLEVCFDPASHDCFPGIAPRPVDTTYEAETARHFVSFNDGIRACRRAWDSRLMNDLDDKAIEISLFLGITKEQASEKLSRGFRALHQEVAADFRRVNPKDDAALLEWYRNTESYIWELSAYHSGAGFNYSGMCKGIVERLGNDGVRDILVLGDGIGTMTIALAKSGMNPVYHDLAGSRTAAFAAFRYWRQIGEQPRTMLTSGWEPAISGGFDAVVCNDFLEHVTDVPAWVNAIKSALRPGALFCAQNAFGPAMGSGPNGSIPMHLERNDRFEKEWDPMLFSLGFSQLSSNWYKRSA